MLAPRTPAPKNKPGKKPKIIQVIPGKEYPLGGVVFDNGRVFFFTYTKVPNPYEKNPDGEGVWSELNYPDLTAFDQRDLPDKA